MKTVRKAILAVLCVVCVIVASVTGTLAYLTDNDAVTNTFTVGKITMTMDEANVNEYGDKLNDDGEVFEEGDTLADRVQENNYKLIPGHEYVKDPIIHIGEDSETCYVFIKVQNDIAAIEDSNSTIASQITAEGNGWAVLDATAYPNVYWQLWEKDSDDCDLETFATFKITSTIDNEIIAGYITAIDDETGEPEDGTKLIKVEAYAIQKDGFTTPADAYAAYVAQHTPANP